MHFLKRENLEERKKMLKNFDSLLRNEKVASTLTFGEQLFDTNEIKFEDADKEEVNQEEEEEK